MDTQTIYIDTLDGIKHIVQQLPDINAEIGKEGGTALELACAFTTDIQVIQYLLSKGADVHHTDYYGRNAFAYAWFNKSPFMDVLIIKELKAYWTKR